jgi:hypothetical protein
VNQAPFAHSYTGARVMPFAPPTAFAPMLHSGPGICRSCGHPSAQCRCGCRECRKEAKDLMVESRDTAGRQSPLAGAATSGAAFRMLADTSASAATGTAAAAGTAKAFIGGGCCVHISVEYAPSTPTAAAMVAIIATDTEGTTLAWEKIEQPGTHYQVKENVITTKPGATVTLFAVNATARIRWCEVFSC